MHILCLAWERVMMARVSVHGRERTYSDSLDETTVHTPNQRSLASLLVISMVVWKRECSVADDRPKDPACAGIWPPDSWCRLSIMNSTEGVSGPSSPDSSDYGEEPPQISPTALYGISTPSA